MISRPLSPTESGVALADLRVRLTEIGMRLTDFRLGLTELRVALRVISLRLTEIRVALVTFSQTLRELRIRLTDQQHGSRSSGKRSKSSVKDHGEVTQRCSESGTRSKRSVNGTRISVDGTPNPGNGTRISVDGTPSSRTG